MADNLQEEQKPQDVTTFYGKTYNIIDKDQIVQVEDADGNKDKASQIDYKLTFKERGKLETDGSVPDSLIEIALGKGSEGEARLLFGHGIPPSFQEIEAIANAIKNNQSEETDEDKIIDTTAWEEYLGKYLSIFKPGGFDDRPPQNYILDMGSDNNLNIMRLESFRGHVRYPGTVNQDGKTPISYDTIIFQPTIKPWENENN